VKINEKLLNNCLDDIIGKKHLFSTVLRVENKDGSFTWEGSRGEMSSHDTYFIASVTKLYVTAVVMSLIEEEKITLNDKIAKFLPQDYIENIHVLKGINYSNEISIKHLISNTSGLPDYFFYREHGKSQADSLFLGIDESWEFERTIQYVKKMKPNFSPGKKGKVAYSDTNYLLLGKIIENVTGKDICNVFKDYIFDKLGLNSTYVYSDIADNKPVAFYYKKKRLWLPKYMASIAVEGGIVSTADEVMKFLKSFFNGLFFPKAKIDELKKWNFILPPPGLFYFGIGLEKLPTPRIISIAKPINEIIGFWGQTGSFAWYNPDTNLYFTGTTNQGNGSGHFAIGNAILKIIKSVL
jgi:CubicO group peptidase (beta-lactamase class C family)